METRDTDPARSNDFGRLELLGSVADLSGDFCALPYLLHHGLLRLRCLRLSAALSGLFSIDKPISMTAGNGLECVTEGLPNVHLDDHRRIKLHSLGDQVAAFVECVDRLAVAGFLERVVELVNEVLAQQFFRHIDRNAVSIDRAIAARPHNLLCDEIQRPACPLVLDRLEQRQSVANVLLHDLRRLIGGNVPALEVQPSAGAC